MSLGCIASVKQTDSYQESFVSLKTLTLYSLYVQETVLCIKEKSRCEANDQLHICGMRTSL